MGDFGNGSHFVENWFILPHWSEGSKLLESFNLPFTSN